MKRIILLVVLISCCTGLISCKGSRQRTGQDSSPQTTNQPPPQPSGEKAIQAYRISIFDEGSKGTQLALDGAVAADDIISERLRKLRCGDADFQDALTNAKAQSATEAPDESKLKWRALAECQKRQSYRGLENHLRTAGFNVTYVKLEEGQTLKSLDNKQDYDIRITTRDTLVESTKYSFDTPLTLNIVYRYELEIPSSSKREKFANEYKYSDSEGGFFVPDESKKKFAKERDAKALEIFTKEKDTFEAMVRWINEQMSKSK